MATTEAEWYGEKTGAKTGEWEEMWKTGGIDGGRMMREKNIYFGVNREHKNRMCKMGEKQEQSGLKARKKMRELV